MKEIIVERNNTKTGFHAPSEYTRRALKELLKQYKRFRIVPISRESTKSRRYLEGAVIPAYCEWQYGIDARIQGEHDKQRFLFKRDFNYEVETNRSGDPVRVPKSSRQQATELAEIYTKWAEQNGAPIPNPTLFKLWRDKWSIDPRFPTFFEFLDYLGLECDAMPSTEHLQMLDEEQFEAEQPEEESNPDKIPF